MTLALATPADVEIALGRTLAATEVGRVEQLLQTASAAAADTAGGFRFAPGDYTVRRRVHRGRVLLPATVESVTSVSSVDSETGATTTLTGWALAGNAVYGIDACDAEIAFTVTADVPDKIVALVAGAVAATVSSPAGGAQSMDAGPFSVSFVDGSGRVWLSKTDKATLCRFRPPKPAIGMLG